MTARPHDALFRSAFEHPDDAAGELRHVLPRPVTDAIDWPTLLLEPGSFIDPDLADRHSDLLFSARIGDTRALIYLLLEHQSTPDPRMPLRMLAYIVRIWERYARGSLDDGLPVIVPVLISHAAGGWTAPIRMHELVDPPSLGVPGLAELVPDFRLVIDDLTRVSDDELHARALALFPTLALWLLRDSRNHEALLEHLDRWAAAFAAVAAAPTGRDAFHKLMRYLALVLSELQFARFHGRLTELQPTTEDAMMSYHEQVTAEAEAKGEAKGRLEGGRETLLKQLTLKFGALDEPTTARVRAGSPAELEHWIERILTATHLDAVFEP